MAHTPPKTSGTSSAADTENLTDRIAARVIEARLAIEGRARASKPKSRRNQTANDPATAGERRETESLRRVFREMGTSYRQYRKETGGPVMPGLRDAAYRFRADPSL